MTGQSKDEIEKLALRDFIYLDVERVKSLLAQMDRGLLTDRSDTSGSSTTVGGKAGVKLPLLLEVGGEGNYVATDQATETRTLHDYVYNEAESRLIQQQRIVQLPQDMTAADLGDELKRVKIRPASYILARGKAFINDYNELAALLADINELMRISTEFSYQGRLEKAKGSEKTQIQNEMNATIKSSQISDSTRKGLIKIIQSFYKDRLAIRLLPYNNPDVRIVGLLDRSQLRERLEDIQFKYSTAPDDDWFIFGQLSSMPRKTPSPQPPPRFFANEIEGAMDTMFTVMRGLERHFGVSYPEIAITPIAIYRE